MGLKIKIIENGKPIEAGTKVKVKFTDGGRDYSPEVTADEKGIINISGCSDGWGIVYVNGEKRTGDVEIYNNTVVEI